jgi:hypothetical protein
MKRIALSILALALGTTGGLSTAQNRHPGDDPYSRSDIARVTRVERLSNHRDAYERQECWNERTSSNESGYYRDDSGRLYRDDGPNKTARTVIGALVGGALGNQVGDGRGRTAATIAGAAIGASVGSRSGDDDRRYDSYDRYSSNDGIERRCRTVAGYDGRNRGRDSFRVSYTYSGQSYQAMTSVNPGRTLRVLVDVRPDEGAQIADRR